MTCLIIGIIPAIAAYLVGYWHGAADAMRIAKRVREKMYRAMLNQSEKAISEMHDFYKNEIRKATKR